MLLGDPRLVQESPLFPRRLPCDLAGLQGGEAMEEEGVEEGWKEQAPLPSPSSKTLLRRPSLPGLNLSIALSAALGEGV